MKFQVLFIPQLLFWDLKNNSRAEKLNISKVFPTENKPTNFFWQEKTI